MRDFHCQKEPGARALSRIIDHRLRQIFESLKNNREEATGKNLDYLLVALLMAKPQGPPQQHLGLNVDASTMFDMVLQTLRLRYTWCHITRFKSALAQATPMDLVVGALNRRTKVKGKQDSAAQQHGQRKKEICPKNLEKAKDLERRDSKETDIGKDREKKKRTARKMILKKE